METQKLIRRRLGQDDAIEYITDTVRSLGKVRRRQLARALCDKFGFHTTEGRPRTGACLEALRLLESDGLICLPPKSRRLWQAVPPAQDVPGRAGQVRDLHLVLAETEEQRKLYNELMIREHPLGLGWVAGRNIQYLVQSAYGILGAVGFGPSALHLAAREKWIGWNREQKRKYLGRIVGMNRFLIRPGVDCRNLASRILSMAVERFSVDFEAAHHVTPWVLETFVDLSRHAGTCYQAANWTCIGQTCGRGRQDRFKRADKTVKAIYVYVLEPKFRQLMGLARDAGEVPLPLSDEADAEDWARNEFGGAELGDKRLVDRLVKIAMGKAAEPSQSYKKSVEGDWTATMGFYRFVEHPDVGAVNMESILAPHRDRTIRRMKACKTVLCIQDTTDLNYSRNRTCRGLGVIGKNQTSAESRGLRLHSSFVTDGRGLPLGLLGGDCYAPELKPKHRRKDRRFIPVEQKESYRWIKTQEDVMAVASQMPDVHVVNIADREADFYELFHRWDSASGVELLIRAQHDRATDGPSKMFSAVEQTPVRGRMQIHISRRGKRPRKGRRGASPPRERRDADVVVRYMPVTIRPPKHGLSSKQPPVEVYLIHVHEPNPPPDAEDPINWYLLTTAKIESFEAAERRIGWYCYRWRIEDWHRVLKSGCCVEASRLKTIDRLKREIAIDMVVAWRVMLMALLGREIPDLPAGILFTELEIEVLHQFAKKKRLKEPENLGEAVDLVGRLGGHLGRRGDPPPGHLTLAEGYRKLMLLCEGMLLADLRQGPDP